MEHESASDHLKQAVDLLQKQIGMLVVSNNIKKSELGDLFEVRNKIEVAMELISEVKNTKMNSAVRNFRVRTML